MKPLAAWGGLLFVIGGCGFSVNPGSALDASGDGSVQIDAPPDAPPPDASQCTSVSQSCADGGTLRTCPGAGMSSFDTTCPWGCITGTPDHCGVLTPTGGGLVPSDLDVAGLPNVVVGAVTINSDTGNVSGSVAGNFAWKMTNGVSVFRATTIQFNGPVKLVGSRPIAFAASGDIIVSGLVDARGGCVLSEAGPGGFPGGAFHTNGGGTGGGGLALQGAGAGAGGGGHGAAGGVGGIGDGIAGSAGIANGNDAISSLIGGSGGGGGGGGGGNDGVGVGGGGGGAVQLASNKVIRIEAGGGINAGGCGGKGSNNDQNDGAGGGGAGGAILLEAPGVEITGALAVNGGGGGAAKDVAGANGALTRTPAAGGDNTVDGGVGGFATSLMGGPGATNANTGGGGGGSVGRIRVNTRTGNVQANGSMSPAFTDQPTTASRGIAAVQ